MNCLKQYQKRFAAILISILLPVPACGSFSVQAEEVVNSWDETKRVHFLRRQIPTAINVYTDGTESNVFHEQGLIDEVQYDILRVKPSEHTFLQVDYSEVPVYLNELKDYSTIAAGYQYAGGINGGYFSNTEFEYGRPVGAVRRHNAWTTWYGTENTPAYGSGYATAYFTGDNMWIRYHGWAWNDWQGDDSWTWWNGYTINAENGISGSYTYFANGEETDITGGAASRIDYRAYGRAVTIFAQNRAKEYLLITIYGTLPEQRIRDVLRELDLLNAIRMDGGGSAQMVYETDLVQEIKPQLAWSEVPEDVAPHTEETLGRLRVIPYHMDIYSKPQYGSQTRGDATHGERYQVYEVIPEDDHVWYRIGTGRWLAGTAETVIYKEEPKKPALKTMVRLPVYYSPDLPSVILRRTEAGEVITPAAVIYRKEVLWLKLSEHEWIPVSPELYSAAERN